MSSNTTKSSSPKADRKTIEKNRRNHMKYLFSQLNSLVHHDHASSSRKTLSLPDQINEAAKYIKNLQENVADLKQKEDSLVAVDRSSRRTSCSLNSPVQIEVHEKGYDMEIVMVTGLESQFVFNEAIRIIHEEHAEVVNATYSVLGSTVFHTIHAQLGEDATSHGVRKITERLKKYSF